MKAFIKIILLIAAVFPLWITIAAMGEPKAISDDWKNAINSQLLLSATDKEKIQVISLSPSSDAFPALNSTSKFEVRFPQGLRGQGVLPIELRFTDEAGRLDKVLKTSAKVSREIKVLVAQKEILRGTRIAAEDLAMEWRDAGRLQDVKADLSEVAGRTAKSNINAQTVIQGSMLERDLLVRIGDRIKVLVVSDSLSVTGFGIAKEAGSRGQTIRVVNPDSRKEIYGVVSDEKVVEVRL